MISVLAVQWDLLPETSHRYTSETSASSSLPRCSLSQLSPLLLPSPPLPFLPSSLVQSLSGGDQNGGGLSILLAPSLSLLLSTGCIAVGRSARSE